MAIKQLMDPTLPYKFLKRNRLRKHIKTTFLPSQTAVAIHVLQPISLKMFSDLEPIWYVLLIAYIEETEKIVMLFNTIFPFFVPKYYSCGAKKIVNIVKKLCEQKLTISALQGRNIFESIFIVRKAPLNIHNPKRNKHQNEILKYRMNVNQW